VTSKVGDCHNLALFPGTGAHAAFSRYRAGLQFYPWQAYNTWGGYDLYAGPGSSYSARSLAVSLDRPYDANGAAMFLTYERNVVKLAERMGLPLAYLTGMDIAADPHLLDGASALISPGHDEYWSPAERAHVTAARDTGVNLAFLGANALFRRI
jgi:N,N-dimethylformamidase beta subunit-like, C-terminal